MQKFTRVFSSLIIFGLIANLFFFRSNSVFSISLFFLLLSAFVLINAKYRTLANLPPLLVSLLTIAATYFRGNGFIQSLSIAAAFSSLLMLWYSTLAKDNIYSSFSGLFLTPVFSVLTYLRNSIDCLRPAIIGPYYNRLKTLFNNRENHSAKISLLIGIIIALPVAVILVAMFASADPIYYSFLKNIIPPEFLQEIPGRIILTIIFLIFLLPLVLPGTRRIFFSPGNILSKIKFNREIAIVMFVTAVIIASFIIVQWPYVFANVAAETDLSRFGVATYAEYVKKGFSELLRVSVVIYFLLWIGLTAIRQSPNNNRLLKILQQVVIAEFIIILISIARRVYLYQLYHGLTIIRVYGSVFLVWLGVMALTLAGRQIFRKLRFGLIEGGTLIFFLVIISFWNVENFIAVFHPPTVNKEIDYIYLSRMSSDGINGWIKAYDNARTIVGKYNLASGPLDKKTRREIAYASFTLRQLTNSYQELSIDYATKPEFDNYVKMVTSFQIDRLQREFNDLTTFCKGKKEDWCTNRVNEILRLEGKLKSFKPLSEEKNLHYGQNIDYVYFAVSPSWQLPDYTSSSYPNLGSFYDSYIISTPYFPFAYNQNIIDRYDKLKTLDRIFLSNRSNQEAYDALKKKVPLADLHQLQIRYYDLEKRILLQSDRQYDRDISLDSPLID